jgi:hypothetical protein
MPTTTRATASGTGVNRGVVGENGVPLATDFTDMKTPTYENLQALSDTLKKQAATSGGVVTPESNAQIDGMIKLLMENPDAFKKLYQNAISFK